ncbi:hypothetical protein FRB90_005365, partial [Tulasnella sp. 427]
VQHVKEEELDSGETITSALVLPSTQTFPLTQAIPFHLQLSVSAPSTPRSEAHRRLPSLSTSRSPSRPRTSTSPNATQRPQSEPALATSSSTLLSLFSDPIFTAPPRGRIPGRSEPIEVTPIVGLGEGMAADGTMYGDPRYGNCGRGDLNLQAGFGGGREERGSAMRGRPGAAAMSGLGEEKKQKSYVRVFLQRQVVVIVKGQKVVKTIACGDGRLHRVQLDDPPAFRDRSNPSSEEEGEYEHQPFLGAQPTVHLNTPPGPGLPAVPLRSPPEQERDGVHYIAWEGYVLPSKDVLSVGGFRTSGLWVKDFITLTMIPPDPEHSPLRTLHHAVPVKLVSDPWEEEWWGGRRM